MNSIMDIHCTIEAVVISFVILCNKSKNDTNALCLINIVQSYHDIFIIPVVFVCFKSQYRQKQKQTLSSLYYFLLLFYAKKFKFVLAAQSKVRNILGYIFYNENKQERVLIKENFSNSLAQTREFKYVMPCCVEISPTLKVIA